LPSIPRFSGETQNSYYIGRCSQLGNGNYETKINYNNTDGKITNYKSSDLKSIISEKKSNNLSFRLFPLYFIKNTLILIEIFNFEISNILFKINYKRGLFLN